MPPTPTVASNVPQQQSQNDSVVVSYSVPAPGQLSEYDAITYAGTPLNAMGGTPTAQFYILKSLRPDSARRRALAGTQPYATIVVQPGDTCGNFSSPSSSSFCEQVFYKPTLDPSCVSLNWSVGTSGLGPGLSISFYPTNTGLTAPIYLSVQSLSTSAKGNYTFTATGTCTGAHPKAGSGTYLPGPGEFTLGNVAVNLIDQTANTPGNLITLIDAVGAQESVYAQTNPSAAQSYMVNAISWTIPGSSVGGYTQGNSSSSTIPVSPTTNPVVFFPTAPYAGSADLTFTAYNESAGSAYHASSAYNIQTPTINSVQSPVGGIYNQYGICGLSCLAITANGEYAGENGIQWTVSWTSPGSWVHGQVGMTQLANITVYDQFLSGDPSYQFNDYFPAVDNGPQYGQSSGPVTATLAAGSSASYNAVDDPFVPLRSCLKQVWPYEAYSDFFTFQPDAKGTYVGIPVTIGTMSWQWQAQTTQNPVGTWSAPQIWTPLSATSWAPSSVLPIWYNNAKTELLNEGINTMC
jgi:hypothetical protein